MFAPQLNEPPQPSGAVPHAWVPQAWACVFGLQTLQVPGLALQENCPVQVPQVMVPVQPSDTVPQVLLPQA